VPRRKKIVFDPLPFGWLSLNRLTAPFGVANGPSVLLELGDGDLPDQASLPFVATK